MLKVTDISKTFFKGTTNEKKALSHLSLTLNDGEQLMSGVPVALQRLENGEWTDVADTKTDDYGHYAFDSLTEGEYRVVSQAVDGLSVAAVGSAATPLGDAALHVVAGDTIRLASGEVASGLSDIALNQPASLSVAAFFDSNENDIERTSACAELWGFADVVGSESGLSPLL